MRNLGGQQANAASASLLLDDATTVKAFARCLLIEQGVDVTTFRKDKYQRLPRGLYAT